MKNLLLLAVFSSVSGAWQGAQAQYILREADAQYRLYNYHKAISLYEQAYKKEATLHAAERLAGCFERTGNYIQTANWYAIAIKMPGSRPDNILHYAMALQHNAKYSDARQQYLEYFRLDTSVTRIEQERYLRSCDSAVSWTRTPLEVKIRNERLLNSECSDWGIYRLDSMIVFASDRGNTPAPKEGKPFLKFDGAVVPDKQVYGWTGNNYLHLYLQKNAADSVQPFPIVMAGGYHVGPASFTANGREMYFAATHIPPKSVNVKNGIATVKVEIFCSRKNDNGQWSTPEAFKYNNVNRYAVGDPFISAQGDSLYFVSDMPGGMGGTDIYLTRKTATGEWGPPENLRELNTAKNERNPVLYAGNFYFSSDGLVGMGGLDIYQVKMNGPKPGPPENMKYPVNSPCDDFSYTRTGDTTGYFSSDRPGGAGLDDIYSFTEVIPAKPEKPVLRLLLTGNVYNKSNHMPLPNTTVTLEKINGQVRKVVTDTSGEFQFNLEVSSYYRLIAAKEHFTSDIDSLNTITPPRSNVIHKDLFLYEIVINKPIRINNIYYDYNKSAIRPDAATKLNDLVKFLKDNPTIWIELGSHTDSRGGDAYNLKLSQARAEAAAAYIISKGIDSQRITSRGYGESQLLNHCANGVPCDEAAHEVNRRTEFKIIKQ